LKLPRPIPLPSRSNHSLVPALFAAALLVLCGAQLLLPSATVLPPPSSLAPRRLVAKAPPLVPLYGEITQAPIFPTSGGGLTPASPAGLDSYFLVGLARTNNRVVATVKSTGSAAINVRVGSQLGDWRVTGIHSDRIVMTRKNEMRELFVGAAALAAQAIPQNNAEEESGE
jgi:hypothetical protein